MNCTSVSLQKEEVYLRFEPGTSWLQGENYTPTPRRHAVIVQRCSYLTNKKDEQIVKGWADFDFNEDYYLLQRAPDFINHSLCLVCFGCIIWSFYLKGNLSSCSEFGCRTSLQTNRRWSKSMNHTNLVRTPLESEESCEHCCSFWCISSQNCRIDSSLEMVLKSDKSETVSWVVLHGDEQSSNKQWLDKNYKSHKFGSDTVGIGRIVWTFVYILVYMRSKLWNWH